MTRKLYYEDLYAREFDAEILSLTEYDGKFHVVLNQTLFYPGGGGQPCDLGTIDGIDVLEVLESGHEIVHVLKSKPEQTNIHGIIDWARRFELM
ncbi:MAG: alanyl-tRNA editing protein, partial [Synergistaceae bacterium]|nr:alanyl-tRNA editing protein [Synergistaceae bacterium]